MEVYFKMDIFVKLVLFLKLIGNPTSTFAITQLQSKASLFCAIHAVLSTRILCGFTVSY